MTIARPALDDMLAHAHEVRPRECCGLLIGAGTAILRSVRARNLAEQPTRYLVDPADHVRALRDARASGVEVLGFYHSHPGSEAVPSPTDLAEASYPECVYLILGVRQGQSDVRLFRFRDGKADEVPMTVSGDSLSRSRCRRPGFGW